MNRYEFQVKEANMAELASMLRTPVLNAAIEIVKKEGFPLLPDPVPGVDYQAQIATAGAFSNGWQRAIRALETLCDPVHPGRLPLEPQFDHAARRKMREAGVYTEEQISSIEP